MAREDAQLKLRLSEDLKDLVSTTAKLNNRSINAEIVARLEESFSGRFERVDLQNQSTSRRLERMERTLTRMLSDLNQYRVRMEETQHNPGRYTPEQLARRRGMRDFYNNPLGWPLKSPFMKGTSQAEHYRSGFRQMLLRKVGEEEAARLYPYLFDRSIPNPENDDHLSDFADDDEGKDE
jgi:hypothetical protein